MSTNQITSDIAHGGFRIATNIAAGHPSPPREILDHAGDLPHAVTLLPPAEIREYLEKILLGPGVRESLEWLHQAGILRVVLPEVEATVDFTQEQGRVHKDVWKHTKQVVWQTPLEIGLRWAALLHDVGKVPTRQITDDGKVTFHGHPEVSARMFDRISKRLMFPKDLKQRVRFLIVNHQRSSQYTSSWTDAAVRRFYREMLLHIGDLLLLSRSDITSARQDRRAAAARQIDELMGRMKALHAIDSQRPPLPKGLGNELMTHFKIAAGRQIGEVKAQLEAAIRDGKIEPYHDHAYYVAIVAREGWLTEP